MTDSSQIYSHQILLYRNRGSEVTDVSDMLEGFEIEMFNTGSWIGAMTLFDSEDRLDRYLVETGPSQSIIIIFGRPGKQVKLAAMPIIYEPKFLPEGVRVKVSLTSLDAGTASTDNPMDVSETKNFTLDKLKFSQVTSTQIVDNVVDSRTGRPKEIQEVTYQSPDSIIRTIAKVMGWETSVIIDGQEVSTVEPCDTVAKVLSISKGEQVYQWIKDNLLPISVGSVSRQPMRFYFDPMYQVRVSDILRNDSSPTGTSKFTYLVPLVHFHSDFYQDKLVIDYNWRPITRTASYLDGRKLPVQKSYEYIRGVEGEVINFDVSNKCFIAAYSGGLSRYQAPYSAGGNTLSKDMKSNGNSRVGESVQLGEQPNLLPGIEEKPMGMQYLDARTEKEFDVMSTVRWYNSRTMAMPMTATVLGTADIFPMDNVEIKYFRKDGTQHPMSGIFRIISVKHNYSTNGWVTELKGNKWGPQESPA